MVRCDLITGGGDCPVCSLVLNRVKSTITVTTITSVLTYRLLSSGFWNPCTILNNKLFFITLPTLLCLLLRSYIPTFQRAHVHAHSHSDVPPPPLSPSFSFSAASASAAATAKVQAMENRLTTKATQANPSTQHTDCLTIYLTN